MTDFQVRLERVAGCRKRRPPADLSWLFSQVSRAAREHLTPLQRPTDQPQHDQTGSLLFYVLPSSSTEGVPLTELQSYRQWKWLMREQKIGSPLRLRRHTIILQPLISPSLPGYRITGVDPVVLQQLQKFCSAYFTGMTVEIASPVSLTSVPRLTSRVHSSTDRRQYLVGDILNHLCRQRPSHAQCVIAMTTVDLYSSPDTNFVLGHAYLHTGCAVFSFGRYFTSRFSDKLPTARDQLRELWVLARVVSHELCHTLGMKHCYYFQCAMNESTSVEVAATQPLFLCPVCLRKLKKWVDIDILGRYLRLKEVLCEMKEVLTSAVTGCDEEASVREPASCHLSQESGDVTCKTGGDIHIPSATSPSITERKSNFYSLSQGFQLEQLCQAIQWLDRTIESVQVTTGTPHQHNKPPST